MVDTAELGGSVCAPTALVRVLDFDWPQHTTACRFDEQHQLAASELRS
jgi:hypothetical protein